jgi:hypothetical protein
MYEMTKDNNSEISLCLSDETVACWVEGLLSAGDQVKGENHARVCPVCREILDVALAVAEGQKVSVSAAPGSYAKTAKALVKERWGEKIMDVVVRLTGHAFTAVETSARILSAPWLPALDPLRAVDNNPLNLIVLEKDDPRLRCRLEIGQEDTGSHSAALLIRDARRGKAIDGLRVILYQGDEELESQMTREGRVSFKNLPPVKYRIEILRLKGGAAVLSLQFVRS